MLKNSKNYSCHKTNEEFYDVVDLNDLVIGVAQRSFIHEKKLFHRAVHVFVFNNLGEIFLQKRSLNKDTAPGKWVSSCSGHVNSGENYFNAAIRELGEEINLYNPKDLELVSIQRPRPETGNEHVHLFSCKFGGLLRLNVEEVMDGIWINIKDLNQWIVKNPRDFAWSFIYLWKLYIKIKED